jgi:hypothetical protein
LIGIPCIKAVVDVIANTVAIGIRHIVAAIIRIGSRRAAPAQPGQVHRKRDGESRCPDENIGSCWRR